MVSIDRPLAEKRIFMVLRFDVMITASVIPRDLDRIEEEVQEMMVPLRGQPGVEVDVGDDTEIVLAFATEVLHEREIEDIMDIVANELVMSSEARFRSEDEVDPIIAFRARQIRKFTEISGPFLSAEIQIGVRLSNPANLDISEEQELEDFVRKSTGKRVDLSLSMSGQELWFKIRDDETSMNTVEAIKREVGEFVPNAEIESVAVVADGDR